MRIGLALSTVILIIGTISFRACYNHIWNDPYPGFQADANNLYTAFTIQPKTLDPAKAYSDNELVFIAQIYEPPYEYNYLLRPYTLQPLVASSIAEPQFDAQRNISTYRINIKPGIYYQNHPAFAKDPQGRYVYHELSAQQTKIFNSIDDFNQTGSRELQAADFVYEIKRLADPKVNSPVFGFLSPYMVGLVELRDKLAVEYKDKKPSTELDLRDYELQGVRVIDDHTYEIDLHGKYPQFKYWLAMPFFAPMPWEAIKFYAQPGLLNSNISIDWYPVGTGPYLLKENNPERRMVMQRNPNYHPDYYPSVGAPGDLEEGYLAPAGKKLPFIDQIIFSLEKESIPYWDKFMQGYYDRSGITADNFNSVISGASKSGVELTPELLERKIRLTVASSVSIVYWGFNMLDNAVGGYSDAARKLRHAISLAFDVEEFVVIFANGRGKVANGPIPPGIFGAEEAAAPLSSNINEAKKLLAEAGYPEGRNAQTGKPLQIYFEAYSSGDPEEKARFAWMTKQLAKINVELIIRATDYNRFMEKMDKGDAQMYMWAWSADYPDPENFMFMFYSKNAKVGHGGENGSNYSNPRFDELFEKFKAMPDDEQRLALIKEMDAILQNDLPWIWGYYPQSYTLSNPWTSKGKPMAIANNVIKYSSTDGCMRATLQRAWNKPMLWPIPFAVLVLVVCIAPAYFTHRKREQSKARRYE